MKSSRIVGVILIFIGCLEIFGYLLLFGIGAISIDNLINVAGWLVIGVILILVGGIILEED